MSRTGALVAALAFIGAHTPSLLPRPWYYQGLIAAICAVAGYVVGVLLGELAAVIARWARLRVSVRPAARRGLLIAWLVLLAAAVFAFPITTLAWQRRIALYVGHDPPGPGHVVLSVLAAVVVFAVFVGFWRLVAGLVDWLAVRLENHIAREVLARVVATAVCVAAVALTIQLLVSQGVMAVATRTAAATNATRPSGYEAPTSPLRSGGPGSPETWASLGQEGGIFVSGGPDRADVEAVTGRPALEPIRVYAGIGDGRPMEAARDAVIAEMERTGAFERSAVLVVTTTGTGWVNEWNASAFEFLGGGDTAIVAMQYSTLPSAFAFLASRNDPVRAARALIEAVEGRRNALSGDRRPRLYVAGESLGAYGGNDAFASGEDMLARVDGALWTGTPSFTRVHAEITQRRNPGSTQVNPVVRNGRHVRFAGDTAELSADQYGRPLGSWDYPRVAYLQHDTDPVVWWSPHLLFGSPPWLRETRTQGPMADMSWYPLVTFWQLTADLTMANEVPGGYGHRYFEFETVPAWAGVLGMDPQADYSRIEASIKTATR